MHFKTELYNTAKNHGRFRIEKAGRERERKGRRDTESDNFSSEDYLTDAST